MAEFSVAPLAEANREDWNALYAAYARFYESPQTEAMRERVWGWLHDSGNELDGLIAVDPEGGAVGLVHYRPFLRPLAANVGGFIDDLYVLPHRRGRGVADALVEAVVAEARRRGWPVVRWITAETNLRARRFYDRIGVESDWVTYQIRLS